MLHQQHRTVCASQSARQEVMPSYACGSWPWAGTLDRWWPDSCRCYGSPPFNWSIRLTPTRYCVYNVQHGKFKALPPWRIGCLGKAAQAAEHVPHVLGLLRRQGGCEDPREILRLLRSVAGTCLSKPGRSKCVAVAMIHWSGPQRLWLPNA